MVQHCPLHIQVTLTIERHYGSRGSVQVRYITFSHTALGGVDYTQINPGAFGAVNMDDGQTTAQIFIDVSMHTRTHAIMV